jgi:chromosomal replication initiator protein
MGSILTSLWSDVLGYVKLSHPQLTRAWFSQLEPARFDSGVLAIRACNGAQVRYLQRHCQTSFAEAAQAATGRLVTVEFEADVREEPDCTFAFSGSPTGSREPQLNPDYTFANFVSGPANRLAHAAAVAIAESPAAVYNPLFVHGPVGLGKTHLLQAICHSTRARRRDLRCLYLTCEVFTNDLIAAVEQGALHQFRYCYRHADLLMVDDVQFLASRDHSQEEFFHTFNALIPSRGQVVLSADCSPAEIPNLAERLTSRFNSGLVASLERPSLETRMAIIRKKAKLRGIEVPEEVVELVASRIETNIRDMEGALIKIDAFSQTYSHPVTLELARRAVGAASPRETPIPVIMEVVAKLTNVKISDFQSKKRSKAITQPRHLCMYLAREVTSQSLEQIGGYFGGRDHSTVLHAHRAVSHQLGQDPQLRGLIEQAKREIRHAVR